MGGKRFPFGELITFAGTACAIVGVSLTWFTLRVEADGGRWATFSVMGWEFTLGVVIAAVAAVAGLLAIAGVFTRGTVKRVVGVAVLLCGVAALAVAIIQVVDAPDTGTMDDQVSTAFSDDDILGFQAKMSGWSSLEPSVEAGTGLWIALAGTCLIVLGGGLAAALAGAKAPATVPATAAPTGVTMGGYAQPAYPQQSAYAPAAPTAPAFQTPVAPPMSPQSAAAPAPVAPQPAAAPAPVAPASPPDAAAAGVQASVAGARFCAKCGASFADDSTRFCTTCGAPRA